MLSGEVKMWRSIVIGSSARNTMKLTTWTIHIHWCQVSSDDADHPSTSVASGYPTNDHFS